MFSFNSTHGHTGYRGQTCDLFPPWDLFYSPTSDTATSWKSFNPNSLKPTDLDYCRHDIGFKGSFSQRVSVPVFVGHGRWILFSGHWELLHSEVHDVLVSAVKPEEDQKVPKPVNRGGTRANTLHKLLWQAPHGEGELTAARSTAHFIIPTLFIKL